MVDLPYTRPDGLVVRRATSADRAQVVDLATEAFDAYDAHHVDVLLRDDSPTGPDRFAVVADGDRIVASICLIGRTIHYGPIPLAVSQPEYVMSRPDVRNRGLIAALFEVVHDWARVDGTVLWLIGGIPYYYRRYGYEYAGEFPWVHVIGGEVPEVADRPVRRATVDDLDDLLRLQAEASAVSDVRIEVPAHDWRALLAHQAECGEDVLVCTDAAGDLRGVARSHRPGTADAWLDFLAGDTPATQALLRHVREQTPVPLPVVDRPGTPASEVLRRFGLASPHSYGAFYLRAPRPLDLFETVRPELTRRLAASALRDHADEVRVSCYTFGFRFAYADGEVQPCSPCDPHPDPMEADEPVVGIPPDQFATLVLGRHGAVELERRQDDVILGRHRGVMNVLFPKLQHDLPGPH